uniref:Uncharacterized protein n=1 Tax=mine drainage metagenome TaxID=410659 RepID=E6QTR9_9ZZZZ
MSCNSDMHVLERINQSLTLGFRMDKYVRMILDASLIDEKTSIDTAERKTGDMCTVSGKIVSGMASASSRTDITNAGPMSQNAPALSSTSTVY